MEEKRPAKSGEETGVSRSKDFKKRVTGRNETYLFNANVARDG